MQDPDGREGAPIPSHVYTRVTSDRLTPQKVGYIDRTPIKKNRYCTRKLATISNHTTLQECETTNKNLLPLKVYCVSLPDTKALDDSGGVSWTVVSERILMQLSSSSAEGRTRQNTSTGSLCELAATTRGLANAWVRSGVLRTQQTDLLCVH